MSCLRYKGPSRRVGGGEGVRVGGGGGGGTRDSAKWEMPIMSRPQNQNYKGNKVKDKT